MQLKRLRDDRIKCDKGEAEADVGPAKVRDWVSRWRVHVCLSAIFLSSLLKGRLAFVDPVSIGTEDMQVRDKKPPGKVKRSAYNRLSSTVRFCI